MDRSRLEIDLRSGRLSSGLCSPYLNPGKYYSYGLGMIQYLFNYGLEGGHVVAVLLVLLVVRFECGLLERS